MTAFIVLAILLLAALCAVCSLVVLTAPKPRCDNDR